MVFYDYPMVIVFYSYPVVFDGYPIISHGFATVFLRFSCGYQMIINDGFQKGVLLILWFSMIILKNDG